MELLKSKIVTEYSKEEFQAALDAEFAILGKSLSKVEFSTAYYYNGCELMMYSALLIYKVGK